MGYEKWKPHNKPNTDTYVNRPLREGKLESIRNSVNRQAPLGQEQWQVETWNVVYFEK